MKFFKILFIAVILLSSLVIDAQQLAFPTAKGAGAYVTGGRGQTVYHVTNLSGDISVSGSFPWALQQAADNYGGTIVFDISGVITLVPNYTNSQGGDPSTNIVDSAYSNSPRSTRTNVNISVLGQTAPFPGITLDTSDASLRFLDIHNIIFRYIKFRCISAERGFWSNQYVDNIIVDHCSFAYSGTGITVTTFGSYTDWTNSSGYLPGDITIQNCLFAHGNRSINVGNTAGTDGVFGDITMARNVFHEMGYRTPLKTGGTGQRDLINNIISKTRNGKRISRFDNQGIKINHISNIYTPSEVNQQETSGAGINDGHKIYTNNISVDNYIYNYDNDLSLMVDIERDNGSTGDVEKDFWDAFRPSGNESDPDIPDSWFVNTQHILAGNAFTIFPSSTLKDSILPEVGACRYINDSGVITYYRDAIDSRYVNDVENNTNRILESVTGWASFGDSTSNTRPVNFYGVNQHIPTSWLTANGYSDTVNIHNQVELDGYTVLEHYVNQGESEEIIISINVPVITILGNNPENIVIGDTYVDAGATAADVEDGDLTANIITVNNVNENVEGSYTVTYNVQDSDNNNASQAVRTVNVLSSSIPVTGVQLLPSEVTIYVGQSYDFNETISPSNATDNSVVWSRSNTDYATVNQDGVVNGIQPGQVTITVTTNDGNFDDSSVVTVLPVPSSVEGKTVSSKKKLLMN